MRPPFLSTSQLTLEHLRSLLDGTLVALHVTDWLSTADCKNLLHAISSLSSSPYLYYDTNTLRYTDTGVRRIGLPFNAFYHGSDPPAVDEYRAHGATLDGIIASSQSSQLSPVESLRREYFSQLGLTTLYSQFLGFQQRAGIIRIVQGTHDAPSDTERPHIDALPQRITALDRQFGINLYLSTPSTGGRLLFWPDHLVPQTEAPSWSPSSINTKPIRLSVTERDLLIINTWAPHAIEQFTTGTRISYHAFMGVSLDSKLLLWS